MFRAAAATPSIKNRMVNHGSESNRRSRYLPMPYPKKMDKATCSPRLLKYAKSFISRQFLFFKSITSSPYDGWVFHHAENCTSPAEGRRTNTGSMPSQLKLRVSSSSQHDFSCIEYRAVYTGMHVLVEWLSRLHRTTKAGAQSTGH